MQKNVADAMARYKVTVRSWKKKRDGWIMF